MGLSDGLYQEGIRHHIQEDGQKSLWPVQMPYSGCYNRSSQKIIRGRTFISVGQPILIKTEI